MPASLFSPWLLAAAWLLALNLIAFCLMGWDKSRSKRSGARRVPEKRLFLAAVLGGSPGAILGMYTFRHKTRHWYFRWGLPAILVLQVLLAVLLQRWI